MSVQFYHEREYDTSLGYSSSLLSKGGTTYAIDTTDLNLYEFKVGKEVVLKTAVAKCSPQDRYERKKGNAICRERLKETPLLFTKKQTELLPKNTIANPKDFDIVETEIHLKGNGVIYRLVSRNDSNFHLTFVYKEVYSL